jgi:hypothetical protein
MTRIPCIAIAAGLLFAGACATGIGGTCPSGRCPPSSDGTDDAGGSAGTGSGASDPGGGIEHAPPCTQVHFAPEKIVPSIELLIDRSGSMLHDFHDLPINDPADPQKFATEQTALLGGHGVVTDLQAAAYFGASMYPGHNCPGLYASAGGRQRNNKAAIDALFAAQPPDPEAQTPTAQSIDLAVDSFTAQPAPAGSPQVIVLATDGIPNDCYGDGGSAAEDATVAAAANAFAHGIRLYLLAVGIKIDPVFQQRLANAGLGIAAGGPDAKAYVATDPASLAAAFGDIIRGVVRCDFQIDHAVNPEVADTGTVTLNGSDLRRGTEWELDADLRTIHILGSACEALKAAPDAAVDATFSCNDVVY